MHTSYLKREWTFWLLSPLYFVIPSLGEEIVFRGLLQPKRLFGGTSKAWALSGLSLLAFILWHPVQIWLGLPSAQSVFLEPAFLMIAGLLGLTTTILTHKTGSLWPGVILHGVVVIGWKALSA
ncbi:CPBP family glutamic-type intramembrane protease [Woodsholea maritima]|uniref:CPBP family glutamic-type intramembrane protease n=1 Tax=Woodsholea maritima TaxID=240237 RepID=UPI00039BC34A|nr:CPBP family glutamic-type intramembrane protease [Woodsholea maritima]